jgi:hypothetical protein
VRVEAQRCVDCVSAVLHAVLTRAASLRALFAPTGVLGVPGPVAPLWAIDLLVDDDDRDLGRKWGGYGGSFADPDGYIWSIAYSAEGKDQPYAE